jgi:hypothetical protein
VVDEVFGHEPLQVVEGVLVVILEFGGLAARLYDERHVIGRVDALRTGREVEVARLVAVPRAGTVVMEFDEQAG